MQAAEGAFDDATPCRGAWSALTSGSLKFLRRNAVLGCNIGDILGGSALVSPGEFVRVGDDLLNYVRQPFHFATAVQSSRPEEDWAQMTQRCDCQVDNRTLPALSLMMIGTFDATGFEAQRADIA